MSRDFLWLYLTFMLQKTQLNLHNSMSFVLKFDGGNRVTKCAFFLFWNI